VLIDVVETRWWPQQGQTRKEDGLELLKEVGAPLGQEEVLKRGVALRVRDVRQAVVLEEVRVLLLLKQM